MTEHMELAEVSAAKDLVMIELEDVVEDANESGAGYSAITDGSDDA